MTNEIRDRLEFSEIICKKVEPLCDPLFRIFGIKTFGYRKFFSDGTSFKTSNNFEWTKFIQEKFDNAMIPNYDEEVKSALKSDKHFALRIGKPDAQDVHLTTLYDCDVWNTLSFYKKSEDFVEGFYFASSRENYKIVEEYINNVELFERFTLYFKEKFNNILNAEEVKKVSLPTVSPFIFEEKDNRILEEDKHLHDFISATPIQRLSLNVNGKEISLSMQEFKCLTWLSRGKTVKEVARIMSLSPRTVESYMENVKYKTRIDSRSKLIDVFILNFSQNRDLLKYMENNNKVR